MDVLAKVTQNPLIVTTNKLAYVRYHDNRGETWVFCGRADQRQDVLRAIGREAADLLTSFDWDDAAVVCECVRELWPEPVCNCYACRLRRELDAEAKAVAAYCKKPKVSLVNKFLAWWYGG